MGRREVEHELATILGRDIEGILRVIKAVSTVGKRTHHRVVQRRKGSKGYTIEQRFIVTSGRQHFQFLRVGPALDADGPFSADIQNGADLFQYAGGKFPQGVQMIEIPRAFQDLAKPLATLVDGAEGLVGA